MKRWLLLVLILLFIAPPAFAEFLPSGPTVTIAATGTTSTTQFQTGISGNNIRVYNSGAVVVFIACGAVATTAAVTSGLPLAPTTVDVIGCAGTHVAAITGGTAATIYVTPGSGSR